MTQTQTTHHCTDAGWMLDDALKMPKTYHAIVFAVDGMLIARSKRVSRDDAERQAAALCGIQALARRTSVFCGQQPQDWRQALIEFDGAYVFLVAAGPNAFVAASASIDVDLEVLTTRLQELVQRLGKELTSPQRGGGPT